MGRNTDGFDRYLSVTGRRIRKTFALLAIAGGLLGASALQAGQKVFEYQLDNGMKIFVKPDHRAPVEVSQVWYKVGASSEVSGTTGVSHVLEHMMFKGTPSHPAGQFSEIISANGGRENAFTGRDYTGYYQFMGADRLEVSMALESDRMRHLSLPPEEFKKEVEVVKEERFMRTDDNPESLTYERFNSVAFLNSPYHNPVIGWREDLDSLTVDDLKDWYDKFYQPNNASLVVVGDVDPEHVYALAKKYFGPIPKADVPQLKPRIETAQKGERQVTIEAPAKVPYLVMGYKAPVVLTAEEEWEPYALDVLAGVLDGGGSARFARELVRKQEIASSVSAGYGMTGKYGTLFLVDGTPAEGHTIEELKEAIEGQLERVRTELVSEGELKRVKASVISGEVYQLDSVQHQANQIGMLETTGVGWHFLDEYPDKVLAITPEQVRKVAQKYLVKTGRTVGVLKPLAVEPKASKPSKSSGDAS